MGRGYTPDDTDGGQIMVHRGSCHCGKIAYEVEGELQDFLVGLNCGCVIDTNESESSK